MPTIKRKVEMNLPELVEWAMENEIKDKMFLTKNSYCVGFDRHGFIYFNSISTMPLDQLFTVEVEEEITEDTKFRHIVFIDDCGLSASWGNSSINDIKYGKDKEFHAYIDGEFKLIWTHEKGLVD